MPPAPQRFFQDPEWHVLENMILDHIKPLLDLDTLDTSKPAEEVKAEIIGRRLHYNALIDFVRSSGMVRNEKLPNKDIFK